MLSCLGSEVAFGRASVNVLRCKAGLLGRPVGGLLWLL